MDDSEKDRLRDACKRERDGRIRVRMPAVHMRCAQDKTEEEIASTLLQCTSWVFKWVQRYREGGIDALRDLPRAGRPPAVQADTMDGFMSARLEARITPVQMQQQMREELGADFHIGHVRRIMREYGMTPKTAQMIHVNHATVGQVEGWQYRLRDRLARLRSEGFTIITLDEAFFACDTKSGRKYWSLAGTRINVPYTGSHKRVAVYGAVTGDGRQMFCTYPRFDGRTFLGYVRALRRRWGKVAILCDRASPHRTRELRRFAAECGDVEMVYLPRGSPYPSPVEACWQRGKRDLLVSEYYGTFADMCAAISEYYRTARFGLDVYEYLYRSSRKVLTNLRS